MNSHLALVGKPITILIIYDKYLNFKEPVRTLKMAVHSCGYQCGAAHLGIAQQ